MTGQIRFLETNFSLLGFSQFYTDKIQQKNMAVEEDLRP